MISVQGLTPSQFLHFVELDEFRADWLSLGLDVEHDLLALQWELMASPANGALIVGTGGLRKLRFSPACVSSGQERWDSRLLLLLAATLPDSAGHGVSQNEESRFECRRTRGHTTLPGEDREMAGKPKRSLKKVGSERKPKPVNSGRQPSVGSEIVGRLTRFVQTLESNPAETSLAALVTVRTLKRSMPLPTCTSEEVRSTRQLLGASQAIFAQFLGVSASAVQDWEQGHKPPRGSACRLMHEIRHDPEYWRKRLRALTESA
jgi:putative transcriptional regulator